MMIRLIVTRTALFLSLSSLFLSFLFSPLQILCQSQSQNINLFRTAYNQAFTHKDYHAMKRALDSIITYDSEDLDARRQRIILAWEISAWEQTDEDYTALIKHDSTHSKHWGERGIFRWYIGKDTNACADLRRADTNSSKFHHLTEPICSGTIATRTTMSAFDSAIVQEINLLRSKPKDYISIAEEEFARNQSILAPREGMMVWRELVQALINTPPLAPLQSAIPLRLAALDHAEDISAHKQYGHRGTDGSLPNERLERYALHRKMLGENIGYGIQSARTLVVGLLLDDGVQGRGHRENLLNARYRSIGVATTKHPIYPCVCVQMFEEARYPAICK